MFSPEQAERVCSLISSGQTLRQVAEAEGISKSLILWNAQESKEFADQYARAINMRAESEFEDLEDFTQQALENPKYCKTGVDPAFVNLMKLHIDTRKWALSKRNPKKYGDKIAHIGEDGGPVQFVFSHVREEK